MKRDEEEVEKFRRFVFVKYIIFLFSYFVKKKSYHCISQKDSWFSMIRAAAEADKVATSKPIIQHEPVPSSVKVNPLKHDSQRMILANAVKKTVKPTRKKSLPVTIKQGPSSPQSPTIGSSPNIKKEQTSPIIKREPHDSDEQGRETKRIKIENLNDSLSSKQKEISENSNEKQSSSKLNFFKSKYNEKSVIEENETTNNSNPLSSLLVYSDNSSDEEA